MAIYRLSIEVLQGDRDIDEPEARAEAVQKLKDLRTAIIGIDGLIVYPEELTAPWGVVRRPDTFNLDFDSKDVEEIGVDAACMEYVANFVLDRG